jgi:hypothetical protein
MGGQGEKAREWRPGKGRGGQGWGREREGGREG